MHDPTVQANPARCRRIQQLLAGGFRGATRRMAWLAVCLCGLVMCMPGPAHAADPWAAFEQPWFTRIGVDQGLPHTVTTAVVQDRRGLIWIGTMGGLVRYDGYRTELFEARAGGRDGLRDSYVRCLLALPDGGVLVGTNAGGLARFDPSTGRFRNYPLGRGGTRDAKIYDLAADGDQGVWMATDRGIERLDLRTDTIRWIRGAADMAPRNFSVMQDRAGNLWVGNDRGLFERPAGSGDFRRPQARDPVVHTVLHNQIWALYQDREGRIWAGSGQAGAAYLGRDGAWHPVPGFAGYDHGARQPTVRALLEVGDRMWIATDGVGILGYRAGDATLVAIAHDPARAASLPGNTVRGLLEDRAGNVWAATDLGAARADMRARAAFNVLPSPLHAHTLSGTNVHGIFVDSRGRVWLGLGKGRIDVIDPASGRMLHLHLSGTQAHRDVQAFAEDASGHIWVATQGMARIDPDSLAIDDSVIPQLDDEPVLSLLRDGHDLLIGTYEGVFRYDLRNHSLEHFRHRNAEPGSLASDTVRHIARVGDEIWYATTRGISIASNARQETGFRQLRHRDGVAGSLPQDYVGGIAADASGRVWISTFGGLAVIDHYVPGDPISMRTIGTRQGLASDKLNTVLLDADGNPWVSMSNGVARIDATTGAVSNLGVRDGQHIAGYIYIAAAAADGDLLFGGLGGLTVVRPMRTTTPATAVPLAITGAVINGRSLKADALPRDGQALQVDRSGRSMRVEFALLDYRAARQTDYSYRMAGFDDGWTHTPDGTPPTAIYTNLPNGDYRLELRAVAHGMHPQTFTATFPVVVKPLWYETLPFRMAVVVLALLVIAGLMQLRTLFLRRQARLLQCQVDERTRDLQAANLRLDELAGTDELSGLLNRRRFLELAATVHAAARDGVACMALLDLDRFKQINDTCGHLAGDAVIRAVAETMRAHCRHTDLAGRFGGEELIICLPDTGREQAIEVIERIREAVAEQPVHHDGCRMNVTLSAGIAQLRAGESLERWISRTDTALYQAKNHGRNRSHAVD